MTSPSNTKWILLSAAPLSDLYDQLRLRIPAGLILIEALGKQPLAVAAEQFRKVAESNCIVKLIAPVSLKNDEFRLLLIEQSLHRTACWVYESVTVENLLLLVEKFGQSDQASMQNADTSYEQQASIELQELWLGKRDQLWAPLLMALADEPQPVGLLSGSFNPLHTGHRQLKNLAEEKLNGPVHYELPIHNADKPPLDYVSLYRRLSQFEEEPVLLSTAATFVEKSELLSGVSFIIGADTAIRVVDPRFYADERAMWEAFDLLKERNCRFLVASREVDGHLMEGSTLSLPEDAKALFDFIPTEEFCLNISSTELRKAEQSPFDLT
ncbi:MAG: hypothetical protein KDA65_02820 [Planctomycetaceae bacterium]|nr:hypothetical protein [Planctomycetaceae bacterium]